MEQEKHVDTAKLLLGEGKSLTDFIARLLDDIANLKAMLHAISIGAVLPVFNSLMASKPFLVLQVNDLLRTQVLRGTQVSFR